MGLRRGSVLDLTVAMPLLTNYIKSERDYFERKDVIHREMDRFLERYEGFKKMEVHFNTLDEKGRGLGGVYLSLLRNIGRGCRFRTGWKRQ